MPIEKKILLYTLDELPTEKAKEKAREWWLSNPESIDLSDAYDRFKEACDILGITIRMEKEFQNRQNPNRSERPCIYYSLGSTQSDGFSFAAFWKPTDDAVTRVSEAFPQDEKLLSIARQTVKHHTHDEVKIQITCQLRGAHRVAVQTDEEDDAREQQLEETILDFQAWALQLFQDEYSNQHSDEHVDEMLRVNEYTFRENGRREDV